MDIISYDEFEEGLRVRKQIKKLSKYYNRYKGAYHLPSKIKGMLNALIPSHKLLMVENQFESKLHYVRIYFDPPKFEKITKDRAAKPVDMLSAIGGTMGLLTGFSILSGVEILYFAFKIILSLVTKRKRK